MAPHIEEKLVTVVAGGLTAEQAAQRAVSTSFTAKAAEQTALSAAARREQAELDYIPTVTLTAKYTRFSTITLPQSQTNSVETTDPAGTVNPQTVSVKNSGFPVLFDNYFLQASVSVPISDYFLRINKAYASASYSEDAARLDVVAARAMASISAKQAFYEWLRGRGASSVAEQTLAVAQAHAADAKLQFSAGSVAGADVLRAEAVVAAAEATVENARAKEISAEWKLRTYIHVEDKEPLQTGESLDGELAGVRDEMRALLSEAYKSRAELKSLDKSVEAARKQVTLARNTRAPSLSAFGDVTYANPNPRRFVPTAEFFPSWSVGALLTWSPKTFLVAGAVASEQETKAAAYEAQREATRDGITRDVVDAYNAVVAADAGVGTTTRQLDSAREAYRVSRLLYTTGRATGTALLDAEFALAQARFDNLNARVDARLARVLLDHAVGRDVKAP